MWMKQIDRSLGMAGEESPDYRKEQGDESQHVTYHRVKYFQCTPIKGRHMDDVYVEKCSPPVSAEMTVNQGDSFRCRTSNEQGTGSMDTFSKERDIASDKDALDPKRQQRSPITSVRRGLRRPDLSHQSLQILSPLVLNPREDLVCAGGCPFTLEEPLNNTEQYPPKIGRRGSEKMDSCYGKFVGRSNVGEVNSKRKWMSQAPLISSASTSKRTSQGSLLGPWEASSNDGSDAFDLPKKGHGLSCSLYETHTEGRNVACSDKGSIAGSQNQSVDHPQGDPVSLNLDDNLGSTQSDISTMLNGVSCLRETGRASHALFGEMGLNSRSMHRAGKAIMADESFVSTHGMELTVFVEQSSRSLSLKYRPKIFGDLVGQDLVVHALSNAVLKGKIAPVYLFHGSGGTGKTSTARILAASLNCCMTDVESRPCNMCSQCKAIVLGRSPVVWEVDAASHNGINNVRALLQSKLSAPLCSRYKVFIIDECHMLTNETWNALLKFLEEPPENFVFILLTTDLERLPRTASSRCQKFFFVKVKHSDILKRLSKLVVLERLDVEVGALDIIASRSDGSLRDAEMTLDQLSLLGETITRTAVLDLVGLVSDEKLVQLLDVALRSDTVCIVHKAQELVNSGVEPLELTTRLARLITDILAGSYKDVNQEYDQFVSRHTRSKKGLEGLRSALRILLETEKQLKVASHDRMAWLIAALLQFGCHRPSRLLLSSSTSANTSPISQKSSRNMKVCEPKTLFLTKWAGTRSLFNRTSPHSEHGVHALAFKSKARLIKPNFEARIHPAVYPFLEDATRELSADSSGAGSSPFSNKGSERRADFLGPGNLGSIWLNILKGCKSLPLRHLLSHGKLLSVCFSAVEAMIHLEFKDPEQKSRAERYEKVIANTCKKGLGLSVDVKISLSSLPEVEEVLGSPLPLLAEHTLVGEDCSEEFMNMAISDCKNQVEVNSIEVGSLHHWRNQSRGPSQTTMEHAHFTHSVPFHQATMNLSTSSKDTLPAFGDHFETFSIMSEGKNGPAWVHEANELSSLRSCCWQESAAGVPRELQDAREMEMIAHDATSTVISTDGLHDIHHGASAICNVKRNLEVDKFKEENLRLESEARYGGLLCWRVPKAEGKVRRQIRRRKRRCGTFISLMRCAKP